MEREDKTLRRANETTAGGQASAPGAGGVGRSVRTGAAADRSPHDTRQPVLTGAENKRASEPERTSTSELLVRSSTVPSFSLPPRRMPEGIVPSSSLTGRPSNHAPAHKDMRETGSDKSKETALTHKKPRLLVRVRQRLKDIRRSALGWASSH